MSDRAQRSGHGAKFRLQTLGDIAELRVLGIVLTGSAASIRSVGHLLGEQVEIVGANDTQNDRIRPSAAARDVLAERQRQVEQEGFTAYHDDQHSNGEMAGAAAAYATLRSQVGGIDQPGSGFLADLWPWDGSWFTPSSPRRDLVKAGALILAEIERLDRSANASGDA